MDGVHPAIAAAAVMGAYASSGGAYTQTGAPSQNALGFRVAGGECSTSRYTKKKRANRIIRRKVEDKAGPHTYRYDLSKCLHSGFGVQSSTVMTYFFDKTMLDNAWDRLVEIYPEMSDADTKDALAEVGWMVVDDVWATTEICNMSNGSAWVTIYDLTKIQSDRADSGSPTAATVFDPLSLWLYGIAEEPADDAALSSPNSPNYVGNVPNQSHRFSSEWHIEQHTVMCLGPGDLHRHEVHIAPNCFINKSRWERYNGTDYTTIANYLANLTYAQVIVHHGSVCANSTGTEATYQQSDLCAITHVRFNYSWAVGELESEQGVTTLDVTGATNTINQRTGKAEPYSDAVP